MDRHHKVTLPTTAVTPLYRNVIFSLIQSQRQLPPQVASGLYLFPSMTNMHEKGFGLGI